MFECDDDLGLDEELFTPTEAKLGENSNLNHQKQGGRIQNIVELCDNPRNQFCNDFANIEKPKPAVEVLTSEQQNGVIKRCDILAGSSLGNELCDKVEEISKQKGSYSGGYSQNAARVVLDSSKEISGSNFRKSNCIRNPSALNVSEQNSLLSNDIFEDGDFSDVFSEDFTFDGEEVEEGRAIKRTKVPRKSRTPCKRKFPGPAGILPECTKPSGFYESGDRDDAQSVDIPNTEFPCTQDSSQFSGQLWLKMCADFGGGPTFLPDFYNIAWIKKQAKSRVVHAHKAPFLAAIIVHVEQYGSKTPNTIITLKDASDQIIASIHNDLYEMYKQDIIVGSVVVLRDFSVLTLSTSENIYITVTPKNLLVIYSLASLRQDTQTQAECTQLPSRTPKVTNIQQFNVGDVIQDTMKYYNKNPASKYERREEESCWNNAGGYVESRKVVAGGSKRKTQEFVLNMDSPTKRKTQENSGVISEDYIISDTHKQIYLHGVNNFGFNSHVTNTNANLQKSTTDNDEFNSKASCSNSNLISSNRMNCINRNSQTSNFHTGNNHSNKNSLFMVDTSVNSPVIFSHQGSSVNTTSTIVHHGSTINNRGSNRQNINFSALNESIVNDNSLINENRQFNQLPTGSGSRIRSFSNQDGEASVFDNQLIDDNVLHNLTINTKESNMKSDSDRLSEDSGNILNERRSKVGGNVGTTHVGNVLDSKERNVQEIKARLNQFRFKKRISDEKENNRGDQTKVEESVSTLIEKETNSECISSTQISLFSDNDEHSQILEEAFEGIDACSFLDDF